MKKLQAAERVHDRFLIELDPHIVKTTGVKNGQLFRQELTEDGILLKRVEDSENEDVGGRRSKQNPDASATDGRCQGLTAESTLKKW